MKSLNYIMNWNPKSTNSVAEKNESVTKPSKDINLSEEQKDAATAEAETKAAALKESVEKQKKNSITSLEIIKSTSMYDVLNDKIDGWSDKFIAKMDGIILKFAEKFGKNISPTVRQNMTTAMQKNFVASFNSYVTWSDGKVDNKKVDDFSKTLWDFGVSAKGSDTLSKLWDFANSASNLINTWSVLSDLMSKWKTICKIMDINPKYIWNGENTLLNDPIEFDKMINDPDFAKLADLKNEDMVIWKNEFLKKYFVKDEKYKTLDKEKVSEEFAKTYEQHGELMDKLPPSMFGAMSAAVTAGESWLSVINSLWESIKNNSWFQKLFKTFQKQIEGTFIGTIIGFLMWNITDYEWDVSEENSSDAVPEKTDYKWSSFDNKQFLALTNIYESQVGNIEWWCLQEVREFMQALHDGWYINLPSNMDGNQKRWWQAKEFGEKIKKYAKDGLPSEWSSNGMDAADLHNKPNNPSDIYNTINPMKWDMFNIVMQKVVDDGWSWAGHIAFGARVGDDIYVYDNSIKWDGDLDFVPNKNWFTLAEYVKLMKNKYNFDSVMSIQSKFYKEVNSESIAETPEARKKYIFDYFAWKFDKDTASAWVGNISVETGKTFDPKIQQSGWWPGRWLCQWETWNGNRFNNLEKFAKENWKSRDDLKTQLDFIVYELNGSEKSAKIKIDVAVWVEAKTEAISKYYERAGKPNDIARVDAAQEATEDLA